MEIRISEVEIICRLIPSLAMARKNVPVTPGWERMPTPTIDTSPIWSVAEADGGDLADLVVVEQVLESQFPLQTT